MTLIKVKSRGTDNVSSRKNLLVNGGMMVDQRNATLQFSASSGYPCDRWYVGTNAIGTFQYTQSTDAPAGFGNSMKIQCTTADTSLDAGSYNYIMHKLEGNALQSMNSTNGIVEHTISFYAKASKTGIYTVNLRDEDNGQGNSKTFTISAANTWERYTLTFPAHSSGKLGNDNLSSYRLYWWMASGSNQTSGTFYNGTWGAHSNPNRVSSSNVNLGDSTSNNFYITGIQMEVGSEASDFEHRSFAEELQLCKRYFQVVRQGIMGECTNANGNCIWWYEFPVEMRALPSVSCTKTVYRYGDIVSIGVEMTSISVSAGGYRSEKTAMWNVTGTASATPTQYRIQLLEPQNTGHGNFQFAAEL